MIAMPVPYQRTSPTSRAASAAVAERAPTQRERVLAAIRQAGHAGLTRDEIAAAVGLLLQSVCGRVSELREAGLIAERGTRQNRTGMQVAVLVAVAQPERMVQERML